MKKIEFKDNHRRKHFEHFNSMSYPHFQVSATIGVDHLTRYIKKSDHHFTSAIVYWLTCAAHEVESLKWRIRGEDIVEHDILDPSFAVETDASDVFSFCTVAFDRDWDTFQKRSLDEIQRMRKDPSFSDEAGKDNFLFMSALPWVSFTAIQHPISMPADSIPRITWGKTFNASDGLQMPVSIQAHHALVDGKDLGRFFMAAEYFANKPMILFNDQ